MTNTKGTPGEELVATSAPRGKIDATRTEYRHSPIDEGIRLEGSQPEPNQSVRGVLIEGSASGKFVGIVEVDGEDYELKGHFDIKKNA